MKAIAPETALVSEQIAAIAALYHDSAGHGLYQPGKGQPQRHAARGSSTTFEGVKNKAQVEEQSKSSSGGGLSGMLA